MDKHFFLYVLQLSNNMYYVHVDIDSHVSLNNVFLSAACTSSLVRENMPIKQLIEKTMITNVSEIDSKVKEYMAKHGYENVRGGSYSEKTLSSDQITVIQREIIYASSISFLNGDLQNFIHDYSTTLMNMNVEDRETHIKNLNADYAGYLKEKNDYENLQKIVNALTIGEPLIQKITYLKKQCSIIHRTYSSPMPPRPLFFMGYRESPPLIELYNFLRKRFKVLTRIFNTMFPHTTESDNIDAVLTKYPEFVLDDFIYHKHYVTNKYKYDVVDRLLSSYVLMCNKLINKLSEYEHALNTWDKQLENKVIVTKLLTQGILSELNSDTNSFQK